MKQDKTKILGLRLGVFLFIFIAVIGLANASLLLFDDFSYSSDLFSAHGWQFSGGACGAETGKPVNESFGLNLTDTGCGFGYSRFIRRDLSSAQSGSLQINFTFTDYNDSTKLSRLLLINVCPTNTTCSGNAYSLEIPHYETALIYSGITGSSSCNSTISSSGTHYYTWNIDFTTGSSYLQIDGVLVCNGVSLGSSTGYKGVSITESLDTHEGFTQLLRDIGFTNSSGALGNLSLTNQPCTSNTQCLSGYCFQGFCQLKFFNMPCINNVECQSGSCTNGRCDSPSLSQNLNLFKNQFFGSDSATSNLIAIILMVGISLAFAFALHQVPIAAAIGSISIFYVLGFIFSFIGWLSAWIIFAMILLLIIGIVAMIILGSRASQGGG